MMEKVVPVVPILFPGIQTPFSTRVLHVIDRPMDGGARRSTRSRSSRRSD